MATSEQMQAAPARLTRRRMIAITAAAAGLSHPALAAALETSQPAKSKTLTWRGIALGAEAQIALVHDDAEQAALVLAHCRGEIVRLEKLFSLFRPNSAVCRLNRDGRLSNPDHDMIALTSLALAIGRETKGAFDVSVQPLWALYARHFASPQADHAGPGEEPLRAALRLVDYRRVRLSSREIRFTRPGMAVTFNGIAQGYVTDRVAALLAQHGFNDVLVHLGETRGMGSNGRGKPWRAGIATPNDPSRNAFELSLADRALATSSGSGSPFSADGAHHHIFDPRTGRSCHRFQSMSVVNPSGAVADALSTAFTAMPLDRIAQIVEARANTQAFVVENGGRRLEI